MKPFFLFTFYQACSGGVFAMTIIERTLHAPDDVADLSFWGDISYWVTAIIDMPVCFALVGLTLNVFIQIYEN